MKSCPACHRSVPDSATVCPHPGCGKPIATAAHPAIKRPPPPGPVRVNPPSQAPRTYSQPPSRGIGRAIGVAVGLLLLLMLIGGVWYAAAVLKYAQLDANIRLVRDEKSPQKLLLEYEPLSGGQLIARSDAGGQQLEMLTQLPPQDVGEQQQTELPWSGIQPGDQVRLTYRAGWWTATKELTVPEAPRRLAKATPKAKSTPEPEPKPESEPRKADAASTEPSEPKLALPAEKPADDKGTMEEPKAVAVEQPTEVLGLYSARTKPDRAKWITQVGGTPESESGVAEGLAWLARHQAEDGHWGPDCLGSDAGSRCEKEHPCSEPGEPFEGADTGLAVLAFQAGGHYYFNQHKYSDNVAHGLDIMVAQQGLEGELVGSQNVLAEKPGETSKYHMRYMYEHAIGTFALAEACATAKAAGQHPNEKYLAAAIKAVKFIESQQHDDGGWRYTPNKNALSDCSVSGWSMLALKTALEAEIKVDDQTVQRMVAFFKNQADELTGRTHYQTPRYGTDALTGVGMMVDQFVLHQPQSPLVQLAAPYLADQAEGLWGAGHVGASDFYTWYNCTLAMFQAGGDPWNRWNTVIRDHVHKLQIGGEECQRGSWEPNSRWGGPGGRIYTTALGVLTLEVYYRFAREKAEKAK